MGAIYGSGFLTLVKVLELVSAVLLLSGRYINLALTLLGPIVVNILFFHVMIKQSDHALSSSSPAGRTTSRRFSRNRGYGSSIRPPIEED